MFTKNLNQPWGLQIGVPVFQVSQINGLLQAPGRTGMYLGVIGSGEVSVGVCLKSILRVTPFNAGELKV